MDPVRLIDDDDQHSVSMMNSSYVLIWREQDGHVRYPERKHQVKQIACLLACCFLFLSEW